MKIALVFPHQLFRKHPALAQVDRLVLVEDGLYFAQYNFHKQKLLLHRASMKFYQDFLERKGCTVEYLESQEVPEMEDLFNYLGKTNVSEIHVVEPDDYLLRKKLVQYSRRQNLSLKFYSNPNFLLKKEDLRELLTKNKNGYFMANFYKKQRQKFDLLMDGDSPIGGQWSFDEENRKKLPKNHTLPSLKFPNENEWVQEAQIYVDNYFGQNYGSVESFHYPVTFQEAVEWLDDFLITRLENFGDYEDAIHPDEHFLYHSVLTPALNIGLLTPHQVLDRTFELHQTYNFPLNSLEGFVRQIIGWREFMRGIYEFEGVFERTNNHWNHTRKIPESFWMGTTGIDPVDDVIKKVLKTGYSHHIERLMIMGNFMLLCEFDPDECYRWFMELYMDAYDWVMVPNVYGMTQYADGGLITTKPYISGSNYIRKMSPYKKGPWCGIWDALYWRFIHKHQDEFKNNQRMRMMVSLLERMSEETLQDHLNIAEQFLKSLENETQTTA